MRIHFQLSLVLFQTRRPVSDDGLRNNFVTQNNWNRNRKNNEECQNETNKLTENNIETVKYVNDSPWLLDAEVFRSFALGFFKN